MISKFLQQKQENWCQVEFFKTYSIWISFRGLAFSSEGGRSQIYKKMASIKLQPPYFGNKNFVTPTTDTPYPPKQAKIVLKSVFWTKETHYLGSSCDSLHVGSSKISWPPYFSFQKCMTPQYIWDPTFRRKCQPPYPSGKIYHKYTLCSAQHFG